MAPFLQVLEQNLNAGHLLFQRLVPIGAGVDLHGGGGTGAANGVNGRMAGLDRLKHRFPLALDRGAVGVQLDLESGIQQHLLTGSDVWRQVDADPDLPGVNYVGGSRQLRRRVTPGPPPAMAGGGDSEK